MEGTCSANNVGPSSPSLSSACACTGAAVGNSEKMARELDAESARALMSGETTNVARKIDSAPVTFSFDGAARSAPAVGLQGALELDMPSIRDLAAWKIGRASCRERVCQYV